MDWSSMQFASGADGCAAYSMSVHFVADCGVAGAVAATHGVEDMDWSNMQFASGTHGCAAYSSGTDGWRRWTLPSHHCFTHGV